MEKTIYICIKARLRLSGAAIDHDDEAIDDFVSEMNYTVESDTHGVELLETEVMGHQDHVAVGL